MTQHILSQIDLEHKTALCTVCGPTEIHVPKNFDPAKSRIYCIQRHKEQNRIKKMWACLSPEERKLIRKERHQLREIDPELKRAVCAICGPTDTYQYSDRGKTIYRCGTYNRLAGRSESLQDFNQQPAERNLLSEIYKMKKAAKGLRLWSDLKQINLGDLSRFPKPKPRVSYLQDASEKKKKRIEGNTRLVHEYKRSHGCKRCGIRVLEPRRIRFFELPFPVDRKVRRLILKLDPEDLLVELEKHDLYCKNCYPEIRKAYHKKSSAPGAAERLRRTLAKLPDDGATDPRRG
jgi:hypothetical protein